VTLILRPTRLHWLNDTTDPADLCVHSPVEVLVNGMHLVKPEDGDCTVTAAALYLLRTLTRPHTRENPVADHLFPCCGIVVYGGDASDTVITGCNGGDDFSVQQEGALVTLGRADGETSQVSFVDWRDAVYAFADEVQAFYDRSPPRRPHDDYDAEYLRGFWREWARRRHPALTAP
jgi:hypothetical protein